MSPDAGTLLIPSMPRLQGSLVSLDCGGEGNFQGRIVDISPETSSVTIEMPMKDGRPLKAATVTLTSAQIRDMKVLKLPEPKLHQLSEGSCAESSDTTTTSSSSPPVEASAPKRSNKMQAAGSNRVSSKDRETEHIPPREVFPAPEKPRFCLPQYPLHSIPIAALKDRKLNGVMEKFFRSEPTAQPPKAAVDGVRISVNELLNAAASSCSTTSGNSRSRSTTHSESSQVSPDAHLAKVHSFKNFGDFKFFSEQQVPVPTRLRVSKKKKGHGPCGIPAVDCSNGYIRYRNDKSGLTEPLDFTKLDQDFDFDANLALFDKNSISDAEAESSGDGMDGGSSVSRNFRNDENILSDPSRVTSWTLNGNGSSSAAPVSSDSSSNTSAPVFKPVRMVNTQYGYLMPVLSSCDKGRYLLEGESMLGSDVLNVVVADRLLTFVTDTMESCELMVKNVVVVGGDGVEPVLVNRLLRHFSNRSCNTVAFNVALTHSMPFVTVAESVKKLPIEVQLVILLGSAKLPTSLALWLTRVCNGPQAGHVISLDSEVVGVAHSHTLYLGVMMDEPPKLEVAPVCPRDAAHDAAVCDLGVPFNWLEGDAAQALTEAFATQFIVKV
ncbi:EDC-3 protein [Aphelenchoides avenae]|nr:EDC-3 protein [Aphelenchus avenae]